MKFYKCDNCGEVFEQPIAEVQIEKSGVTKSIDLCSPCISDLENSFKTFKKGKYETILEKQGVAKDELLSKKKATK